MSERLRLGLVLLGGCVVLLIGFWATVRLSSHEPPPLPDILWFNYSTVRAEPDGPPLGVYAISRSVFVDGKALVEEDRPLRLIVLYDQSRLDRVRALIGAPSGRSKEAGHYEDTGESQRTASGGWHKFRRVDAE